MECMHWRSAWVAGLVLGLAPSGIAVPAIAQDVAQDEAAIDDAVDALFAEYDAASAAFYEKYGAAKTEEERAEVAKTYPDASKWFPQLLAIGEEHTGTNGAVRALIWIVEHSQGTEEPSVLAREYLMNDYLLHPNIGPLCDVLSSRLDAASEEALRRILAENPERGPQGRAAYALAKLLMQKADLARRSGDQKGGDERKGSGKANDARTATLDPAKLEQEAESLYEKVVEEYADVAGSRGKLGALASAELFERRNLLIGKTAPDIAGEDTDGTPFKLSDYKGKVVMLDFWGNW